MPSLVVPVLMPDVLSRTGAPTLIAGAVVLRPWCEDDVPALVSAYEEPQIQRWHALSMTHHEAQQWVTDAASAWSAATSASWAVECDGQFAGRMTLRYQLVDAIAVAAYWTCARARGRGVAPRALVAAVGWAFSVGFHRIELEHSALNRQSCRVAARAGLALEGVRRHGARHADGWHDMHLHATISDLRSADSRPDHGARTRVPSGRPNT